MIDACLQRAPADRPADLAALAAGLAPFAPGGHELAAEVSETLGAVPRAPRASPATSVTPRPARAPAGLASAITSQASLVGATSTQVPPPPASRRRGWRAAVAITLAMLGGVTWYATRDRSPAGDALDATTVTLDGSLPVDAGADDARAVTVDANAAPAIVDAGMRDATIDARAPRRVRPPPPPTPDAAVNPSLPLDAGITDPVRHPRDRRN